MNPLLETAVDAEPALLQCRLAEEGYVFVRGLLNPGLVGEARDVAVGCLEEAGLASGAERPIWSGRAPRENELASDGPIVSEVADDGVLCRLGHSAELVRFLERLIGGEVFVWQDCAGRLRIMLGDHADDAGPLDRCGSPQHACAPGFLLLPAGAHAHLLDPLDGDRRVGGRPGAAPPVAPRWPVGDVVEGHGVPGRAGDGRAGHEWRGTAPSRWPARSGRAMRKRARMATGCAPTITPAMR